MEDRNVTTSRGPSRAESALRANRSAFSQAWDQHRGYLLNVAYRLVGSFSEGEDLVQEAYARLLQADPQRIEDARKWLVVVLTRLSIDHLRSAKKRRENTVGVWLPEPIVLSTDVGADPADVVTMDESVRMALLVVLERLTPAERAVFILHDVFEYSFDEIAPIVEHSSESCRQLASRARRRLHADAPEAQHGVDPGQARRLAQAFADACIKGDVHALIEVLDPAVVGWADLGAFPSRLAPVARGSRIVAEGTIRLFGPASKARLVLAEVNGETGVVVIVRGRPFAVLALTPKRERIGSIFAVADGAKLKHVRVAGRG